MARREYSYQPPSYEETVARAERKGSMFDSMFRDAKFYTVKQGVNLVRILPPTWKGAEHYGLTIFIHYGVGAGDRRYLCLRENPNSPHKRCPICEYLASLGSHATQEDKTNLRPKAGIAYYVIDRDAEKEGPQVWVTSPSNDSEIAAQSINRRSGKVINIIDEDNGYDVEFTRRGTGKNNTRYNGFQVMRESSPLAESTKTEDVWLDMIFDKPLPSLLQFYSPEHIEEVLHGRAKDEDEGEQQPRSRVRDRDTDRGRGDDDDADRPLRRTRGNGEDDPPPDRGRERPRSREVDEDEPGERPPRSRREGRDETEDDNNDAPSRERSRPARERGADADPERERPARSRPRLDEELDDSIPSDAGRRGRTNGRDDADPEERPARSRPSRERDPEPEPEPEERPARSRPSRDPGDSGGDDDRAARRERVRQRLNQED